MPGFAGVHVYNRPVCGTEYVPVDLGRGNYFNTYNAQNGTSCINVSGWHDLAWSVTRAPSGSWESPFIGVGWSWQRNPCNDGRSGHSKGTRCMLAEPVQQYRDGMPVTSVAFRRPACLW